MSTPVKIILAVFALLGILVAAGIGGILIVGRSLVRNASDPAAQRQVAARLGVEHLPPGYHIVRAVDLLSQQEVDIGPTGSASSFKITLKGGTDASAQTEGVDIGLRLVAGFSQCDFHNLPIDTVEVAGKTMVLQVRGCPSSAFPMRVETGRLPNGVAVLAMGSRDDFDLAGLHAVLRALK